MKLKLLKNELVPWELDGLSAHVFERIPMFRGENGKVSFLGRRQQHMDFEAVTKLYFEPEQGESAGIVVIQNDANQLRMECQLGDDKKQSAVCISTRTVVREGKQYFEETVQGSIPIQESSFAQERAGEGIYLKMTGHGTCYSFFVSADGVNYEPVAENVDGSFMGSETSGGFIGAYIGLFASGGERDREKFAAFDMFRYVSL